MSRWCLALVLFGCGRLGFDPIGPIEDDDIVTTGEWRSVAVGRERACGVTNTDELWCWGKGDPALVPLVGPAGWATIAVGEYHACGVSTTSELWCFGSNTAAALGNGESGGEFPTPIRIGTALWSEVAAGDRATCGIQRDGSLWCWGTAVQGALGIGMLSEKRTTPTRVGGNADWHGLGMADDSACALRGTSAWCWGENGSGQIGDGTKDDQPVPVEVQGGALRRIRIGNDHACGIDRDDRGWCWGENSRGELGGDIVDSLGRSPLPGTWRDLMLGSSHTCGISNEGAASCWGSNDFEQLAIVPSAKSLPVTRTLASERIARGDAGNTSTAWVTMDGRLLIVGQNVGALLGYHPSSPALVMTDALGWARVAMGGKHGCGITTTGELRCWGSNGVGQVGDGSVNAARPVLISGAFMDLVLGAEYSLALDTSGKVWGWGDVPEWSTALLVPTELGISASVLDAGPTHWCAIDAGDLFCAGANGSGQLGDGTTTPSATPVRVGASSTWSSVATGKYHTCGVDDGQLFCWGANGQGQLGRGTFEPSHCLPDPIEACTDGGAANPIAAVSGGGTWTDVYASHQSTCAVGNGISACWGDNTVHPVALGDSGPDQAVPVVTSKPLLKIAMGDFHACGFDNNNQMWCWGHRNEQAPDFAGLTAVGTGEYDGYAGGDHTGCAVDDQARRWCWGYGADGQYGDARAWTGVPVARTRP